MRNIIIISFLILSITNKAQEYSLRTYSDVSSNSYLKDTNNELNSYEGVWKGNWDGKTIQIVFKKITYNYNENLEYYKDYLIGKFKVTDSNGSILFDNTNLSDNEAKIKGGKFRKDDGKYSLIYLDFDLCGLNGNIKLNFADANKNSLQWNFSPMTDIISLDCPYLNTTFPEPLPKNIILTKQ
ncbi:DUF6705 family protein [Chryseobacterium sp. CT-SW4]|uniref:DUF6705 family protein n=1 Tax=Chryseobacterium sp. SW-1 TaxID=3157343 RepID=UPI003B01DAFC